MQAAREHRPHLAGLAAAAATAACCTAAAAAMLRCARRWEAAVWCRPVLPLAQARVCVIWRGEMRVRLLCRVNNMQHAYATVSSSRWPRRLPLR